MAKVDVHRNTAAREEVIAAKKGGLGTFGGVFTPSLLTILGVIMYLRFGWVVGNVGVLGTLLIVTMSTTITFLTSLSVAEIATDQRVRVGGAYYMISRSLGIEIGGAIGIPLYLAQALSIALYIVGFAESVHGAFPQVDIHMVGVMTTVAVTILVLISTQAAIRAQYFIMAAIGISLLSLLFGRPAVEPDILFWRTAAEGGAGFWVVFAVFFPAVTGIMAGVNMSGDLENPAESIPKGTFAAVGTGYIIYMVLPVILSIRASTQMLIEDPLVMRHISFWGDAILMGVWGATLSSAVGSMMGAPRVLQAIARDNILPRSLRWLGHGSGVDDIPRLGTYLTAGMTLFFVYFADLNIIAPVLTMFFLTTYAVLNIAAGVERFLGSPSFRPKFKVHWAFSILGAIGCIAVMLLINAVATAVAFAFVIGVFLWLERRALESTWGDVRQGVWLAITRWSLLRISSEPHPKNWRPHLLILSGAPMRRWHLMELASGITHDRALMTISTVVTTPNITKERLQTMESSIIEYLAQRGVQAMVRVTSAVDPFEGAEHLVDTYGLGSLVPNTVLLGDSEELRSRQRYCQMITHFYNAQRNTVIVAQNDALGFGGRKVIDVWWGGLRGNGSLMMILAHLLHSSLEWPGAQVRVRMVVPHKEAAAQAHQNLRSIIDLIRIEATPDILVSNGKSFYDILPAASADSDLIFIGLRHPEQTDNFTAYYERLREKTHGLPTRVFVLAAEEIAFRDVLMQDEGED